MPSTTTTTTKRTRASKSTALTPPTRTSARRTSTHAPPRAQNDNEILTSFHLFSLSRDSVSDPEALSSDEDEDEDEGVIKITDVRRALNACNLPKPPADFFEEGQVYLGWRHFLELAKTLREMEGNDGEEDDEEEEDEEENGDDPEHVEDDDDAGGFEREDAPHEDDEHDEEDENEDDDDEEEAGGFARPKKTPSKRTATSKATASSKPKAKSATTPSTTTKKKGKSKSKAARSAEEEQAEIAHAFSLFTHSTTRSNITLQDLRRVARELREEVDDRVLILMIEEANGAAGRESVGRGVGKDEFEGVMRRAGVFG